MVKRIQHIVLIFTLLLLGGLTNGAWADVTYHILTRPFTTYESNGSTIRTNNGVTCENIRVEALRFTSSESTVGMLAAYKSPLLKDVAYHYYKTVTTKTNVQIYASNGNVKYTVYSNLDNEMAVGSNLSDNGDPTDIYVIYDYDPSSSTICTALGQSLKLDGTSVYNIEVGNNVFFAYNQVRGNRPALIPKTDLYSIDQIASDEIEEVKTGLYNDYDKKWGKFYFFKWKFYGNDPYNISIVLAYDGDGTYDESGTRTIKGPDPNTSNMVFAQVGANMWVSNESNYQWNSGAWQRKYGWYRGMNPPFNSFAILTHPASNYTLTGTKINSQPNDKGLYMHLNNPNPGLNPKIEFKSANNAAQIKFYKVKEYIFKVKTPLSNTVLSVPAKVSEYYLNDNVKDHVPEALKRKYVNFIGSYREATFENANNTFKNVDDDASASVEDGKKVIWLKYESTLPFTTAAAGATYDDLTWYNFYTNKDDQYIVRYNTENGVFNTTGTDGSRYARTSHFAFVGDPFEMKIVSRQLSDANGGTPHYLKLNTPISGNITEDTSGTAWDILYDDNSGDYGGCFRLREFTSTNNSVNHLAWYYGSGNYPLIGTATQGDAARLTVVAVPQKNYVYHIMRSDHSIAVKATISQEVSTKLNYSTIPEIIRSPFLALTGVTLSFYSTSANAIAGENAITYAPDNATNATQDIWVRYNMGTALSVIPGSYITGGTSFNVNLNGQFIYYDSETETVKSSATIVDSNSDGETDDETNYLWTLGGSDPYAMTIVNSANEKYVTIADWADGTISWSESAPASKFIIKGTENSGVWEVMAATGDDVDAGGDLPLYYNIGRNASTDVTKMYSNGTYQHGFGQLSFQLKPIGAKVVTYHLIDKARTDLLQVTARHLTTDPPLFPIDYWSPLVTEYHYWSNAGCSTPLATIGEATAVYVTYDTSTSVDLLNKKTMYLLKFTQGTPFKAEDGSDGLEEEAVTPVYPYCNGDCNFFVYGQDQFDLQQQGAASTRTRWAWFLESANNDPYHVKICSRQTETYNEDDIRAYFATYQPSDYNEIVTGLVWPNISGIQGTEYMILGSSSLYRLETTNPVALDANHDGTPESTQRYTVKSFEQYWKTYDTVRRKILNQEDKAYPANPDEPATVPHTPYVVGDANYDSNRNYLTGKMGFHNYRKWAYAKRWNGYNISGKTSKGWEEIEHWFQTVEMGEGYFTLVPIDINPVLILLDQHGWEIMRKPLPTSPDDETKYAKYDEIRPYDSPMVKEYYFWTKASKRSGFHQYYNLSQQVMVDGKPFTSTSLTELPPYYTATNLHDAKGNHLDEYVTYTVKDEYTQTYNATTGEGQPFLIQQGSNYASYDGSTLTTPAVPTPGGMSQYIIDNISGLNKDGTKKNDLWYVKPNARIDYEMGYVDASETTNLNHDWTNDYTGNFSNGFDPYNIQISSVAYNTNNTKKYFVTNATGATLEEGAGSLIGTYRSDPVVAIGAPEDDIPCSWYDSRALAITNATFMAVQDDEGNMQLMPRFDHTKRMKDFSTLTSPTDPAIDHTFTQLFRPLVYNYHILDNDGHESLRYRSGGELAPQMPDHFKSPLAKDFKYYSDRMAYNTYTSDEVEWTAVGEGFKKTATSDENMITQIEALSLTGTYFFKIEYFKKVQVTTAKDGEKDAVYEVTDANSSSWGSADGNHQKTVESEAVMATQAKALTAIGDYYYKIVYYRRVTFNPANGIGSDVASHADISNREIASSFASAGLTTTGSAGNDVYVRYTYDDKADALGILEGKWLTMSINNLDAVYNSGIKQASDIKPTPVDGSTAANKSWQWKFLKTPQDTPDPYAVQLFNRNNPGNDNELPTGKRFALLPHVANGSYALAEAGTESYDIYKFLNGDGTMSTSVAANVAQESGFLSTSCNFSGTNSQIMLTDEVSHEFTYKIYTNGGILAISATQDNETMAGNMYVPILPETIMSPLLNSDQFRYYNKDNFTFTDGNITATDTIGKALTHVYGLYDDEVIVHYTPYNPRVTNYKVPNERNAINTGQVERANSSNDASIGIHNELLYNIIWHNDNMMTGTSENTIIDRGNRELGADPSGQIWYLAGDDPYAIKLRTHVSSVDRYLHKSGETSCNLTTTADDATTFMLLPREDNYEYGMLQITGGNERMTGFGSTLTTDTPNKFIIFALSTHKVTYHLVIANINSQVTLYNYAEQPVITIDGTTQRNLSNNPIDPHAVGHVSLGDPLKVPTQMYRPNVDYYYYVGDIYNVDEDGVDNGVNADLTQTYKGKLVTAMAEDPDLVGKHVHIYIVYTFQGGLATNAGEGFVTDVTQNKWYTFEAKKNDGTPLLTQFTNAWGMEVKEGRGTHYTNDYLWTPIGDPYGYVMYHRYTCVNSGGDNKGEPKRIMTTTAFSDGQAVTMGVNKGPEDEGYVYDPNSVYELLADEDTTPGYFKIHPVANSAGTQYYFKIIPGHEDPEDDESPEHDYVRLSSDEDYTEFTFGLSEDMVKPYYDRAGYVGGLTTEAKAAYKAVDDNTSYSVAKKLMEKQTIVYNPANIVKYEPGYYRLHSPSDIAGITTRYASGYNHKKELTGDGNLTNSAIPMHFYERKGVNTTFEILANGYTRSAATQGAISITAPEYDPASIFYFYEGNSATPMSRVQTQGLYVKGAKGPGLNGNNEVIEGNVEATNERAAAIMTETEGEATPLYIMDIGGAILLIHDNVTGERRGYLKYLSFDQNDANHIYDLKLTHNTHTDHAKWLMEPVNAQGITLNVHSGGDAGAYGITYYYSTWYAPFDVLLPNDNGSKRYVAYLCDKGYSPWAPPADLHPRLMSVYNTAENDCPADYRGSYKFIPANTPALIATTDNAGVVKMTVPTSIPSTVTIPNGNTFTGVFLEQKLDPANPVRDVFVFGLPFTSTLTKDGDYNSTGNISGTLPEQAQTGVGFYINANPNKELGLSKAEWKRNNLYVLANRIYYRAPAGSPARENTRGIEFVPVVFDNEEGEEEENGVKEMPVGDGCVYDLLGRKVATKQQVEEGTWRQNLRPGIYILNGRKIRL